MGRARFAVQDFEYIRATDKEALVRLAVRWRDAPTGCSLLAIAGDRAVRFEELPKAPDAIGDNLFRGAWSGPLDVVERDDTRFVLETPGGRWLELPAPRGQADRAGFARSGSGRAQTRRRELSLLRQEADEARAVAEAATAAEAEAYAELRRLRAETAGAVWQAQQAEAEARGEAERLRARVRELEGVVAMLRAGCEERDRRIAAAERKLEELRTT
jgi:hypothetical protein